VDLALGPVIFGCCGLRDSSEQSCGDGYVLARPGEVREITAILDDPSVHITSDGARTPTISTVLDLMLKFCAF
jgi:hypothetical protein